MKTYFIVESRFSSTYDGIKPMWQAHHAIFNRIIGPSVLGTKCSFSGPEKCERNLLDELKAKKFKRKIVKVVRA